MAFVDAAGQVAGAATVTATAALLGVLAGVVAGQGTAEADSHPQGAGTASGTSTATLTAAVVQGGAGTVTGAATVTCAGSSLVLVSGFVHGTSTATANLFTDGAGQANGAATVTATANRIISGRGRVAGTSSFQWTGAPLPIHGTSTVVCNPVVDHHLPAIRAIVPPNKSFRYLERFERGDLPIFICDQAGPISPVWVRFTLYQVCSMCSSGDKRWRRGPAQRAPAQGVVGEYYATGRAGESGQPGNWVIVWEFRRNLQSATQSKEMEFQVLDAVAANDPRDALVRHRKYGWN